jgi:hypothetical protein
LGFIKSEYGFLLGLFSLAFVIRLLYLLPLSPNNISPDAFDWMNTGLNVAAGKGIGDSWRPPGYSAVLGAVFFIFGKSVLWARVANAVFSSLTCVILYFTGKKVFNTVVGGLAALMASCYPYYIAYSGDLLSEIFLTFMISLSVLAAYRCKEKPSFWNCVLTGVVFGLTALTKSVILPFFLLACAWLWWNTKQLKSGLLVGVFMLLTISGWTLRNHFYYKDIIPVSTPWLSFGGSNCDEAFALETSGELDTPMPFSLAKQAIPKWYEDANKLPPAERDRELRERGLGWIRNNPGKFSFLVYKRTLHFWRLYPMMAYKWQKLAAKLTSGIYIPLCFLGIALSYRRFRDTSLLIALFASYTAVYVCFAVTLRYRVPIDTFIMLFASYFIYAVYMKLAGRHE